MEAIQQRLATLESRVSDLERTSHRGDAPFGSIDGKPAPPPNDGKLFPAVEALMAADRDNPSTGRQTFVGFHRTTDRDDERVYQWQLGNTSEELLTMEDEQNVRVLSALANPIRLRMMKAILQQPGTAAELRERLHLSSPGQTYHAINALLNGGMIRQDDAGSFEAVGDKASGFLILLGGLAALTESKYRPAFDPSVPYTTPDVHSGPDMD